MTNTGNLTDTSSPAADAGTDAGAGTSDGANATLTPAEQLENSKLECYCRQYSNWKENNSNRIVEWTPTTISCSSITNDYNTHKKNNKYTPTSYNDYMDDVKRHCSKKCLLPDGAAPGKNETGDHTVNDCLDTLPNSVDSTIKDRLAYALRKEHNLLNKLAQKIVSIKQNPNPGNELLLNIENNLQKNINLNNEELKRKARSINTKKRMLLYDEETDRLYRMIIFILKFLLLVISIVTIKLIYDY